MSAELETPFIDFELIASDPGSRPGRIGHQLPEFRDQKLQQLASSRQRIRNPHHELDLARPLEQTAIDHVLCVVEHRHVEHFDLGLDVVLKHRARQILDELWRVFVDLCRKIHRSRRERSHVRLEVKHAAAFILTTASAPGRELHDHLGAMLYDSLLDPREKLRVGTRTLIAIAHMDMRNRGARLESFMCGFNLLARRHRDRHRIGFTRNGAGNGHSDDGRDSHASRPALPQ